LQFVKETGDDADGSNYEPGSSTECAIADQCWAFAWAEVFDEDCREGEDDGGKEEGENADGECHDHGDR